MRKKTRTGTVPVAVRRAYQRSRILEAAILGIAASLVLFLVVLFVERLDPEVLAEPFSVEVRSAEPVTVAAGGGVAAGDVGGCSLAEGDVELRIEGFLPHIDTGEPVAPACAYRVRWEGQGKYCLMEFPLRDPKGVRARGLGGHLAHGYSRLVQGGVIHVRASRTPNTLLMVGDSWCNWAGVEDDFFVVH